MNENYGVTYINPSISTTEKQYEIWSWQTLLHECAEGVVIILTVYDIAQDKEWEWEN